MTRIRIDYTADEVTAIIKKHVIEQYNLKTGRFATMSTPNMQRQIDVEWIVYNEHFAVAVLIGSKEDEPYKEVFSDRLEDEP